MSEFGRSLEASYRSCWDRARRAGSSFYPAFWLLPRDKRKAMHALYAFLRHTDDLADDPLPVEARRQLLARWRASLREATSTPREHNSLLVEPGPAPSECQDRAGCSILPALADTVRRYRIPVEHLEAVIDGVQQDLDRPRFQTFAELEQYCHCVASAVGLACIHIWGFRSIEAFRPARSCGVAYQLTNILRDLGEDADSGRVYLPLEDLQQCGYSVEDLLGKRVDARFLRLMELELQRARRCYEEGTALNEYLEPEGRRIFGMMTATYRRLLQEIDRRKEQVFSRRICLSRWQKLLIAARWFLYP